MRTVDRVASDFRWQADGCRALGSELYGVLLDRCAEDLEASGPTAAVLAAHMGLRRRDVLPLRMLAGVHALVLAGAAPTLAAYYPSVGGSGGDEAMLWSAFQQVLVENRESVSRWLDHAPQTNEVGRAAALAGGLRHVLAEASFPVRLVEIGASAGLNLRADHFRIDGAVASSGPADSPLVLRGAWLGAAPPAVATEVVERLGVDLAPIDSGTSDGQLRLAAFVWGDQPDRLARLRAAIEVARRVPAELRAGDAIDTVRQLTPVDGTWTVLWQSVFRQYLTDDQIGELTRAVAAVGETATATACFAHLTLEPDRASTANAFPVSLTTWPNGQQRLLGTAPGHGLPVTWR